MKLPKKLTCARDVTFVWESALHTTEIKIKVPDFSKSKVESWSDWGPMHTVEVDANDPLEISYLDMKSNLIEKYTLEESRFELNSPMIASIRSETPLFFQVQDKIKGFVFHLRLNKESEVAKVDVFRLEDRASLYSCSIK